jgi:MinD-like ATPase involved in chromosome partitioning or flagellar assembly
MTERDYGGDRDYPDGSVGRYVRERWGAPPARAQRPYIAPIEPVEAPTPPSAMPPSPPPRVEPDPYDDPYDDLDAELDLERDIDIDEGHDHAGGYRFPHPVPDVAVVDDSSTIPGQAQVLSDAQADLRSPRVPMSPAAARSDIPPPPVEHRPTEHVHPSGFPHEDAAPGYGQERPPPVPSPRRRTAEVPQPKRAPRGSPARDPLPEVPTGSPRITRSPGALFDEGGAGNGAAQRTPPRGAARWTDPTAVAAQEAQRARSSGGTEPPGTDLSSAQLLRPAKRPPQSGWRRLVYVLSGRLINPGESPADVRRRELTARVNSPLLGCYKIAMLSLKGGVGKTTVTATLGSTFASLRGDRVVAVDANPDRGTLSQKIPLETSATVRHLLRDAQRVRRYTDVRAYTSQGPSRLEVLASEQDPAVSEAFSEDDYRRTVTLLEHFYNIVLTDCGTGLMHSAMYGVLGVADQLIIVSSGSIDGARSASATMDWLDAHGHGDLVRNAVAVINCVHRSSGGVDLDRVAEHFAARCRKVVRIPFDSHLEEGAEVDLDRLEPTTRLALLELAATVADAFEGVPS